MGSKTMLTRIKAKMTASNWHHMVKQAEEGDIEWATDMFEEVIEGIKPGQTFYLKGYHSIFRQFTNKELEQARAEWFNKYYGINITERR